MPPDTEPLEDTDDSATYTWTIRVLYAAGLAMNVYLLWQMSKDDVELQIIRRKVTAAVSRALAPVRAKREWQKKVAFVHWQAREIVEEGTPNAGP